MSTLDDIINGAQRSKAKLESVLAHIDGIDATSQSVSDVGHGVGSERYINGGQEASESAERGRAYFQAAIDRNDEIIAEAEALKTAGPGAAPSGTSSDSGASTATAKPEYVATTGADPKPNPIHATPAHTREPSRKIGDPVKPPHEIASDGDDQRPRRRRLSKAFHKKADEIVETSSDAVGSNQDILRAFDTTPAKTYPTVQQPTESHFIAPVSQGPDPSDFVAPTVALFIATFELASRRTFRRGKNDR